MLYWKWNLHRQEQITRQLLTPKLITCSNATASQVKAGDDTFEKRYETLLMFTPSLAQPCDVPAAMTTQLSFCTLGVRFFFAAMLYY